MAAVSAGVIGEPIGPFTLTGIRPGFGLPPTRAGYLATRGGAGEVGEDSRDRQCKALRHRPSAVQRPPPRARRLLTLPALIPTLNIIHNIDMLSAAPLLIEEGAVVPKAQ
jgi:hypothetical protein